MMKHLPFWLNLENNKWYISGHVKLDPELRSCLRNCTRLVHVLLPRTWQRSQNVWIEVRIFVKQIFLFKNKNKLWVILIWNLHFSLIPTLLKRYFQVNWLSDSHGGSAAFHSRFWSSSTTRRVVISSENTQADGSKGKRTTKSHNYLNIITSFELSKFVICAVCIFLKISLHCELLESFIL